jgi:hypothetical protein
MTAGRPTKYNKEMQKKADEYLENYEELANDAVPSIAGISRYLHVARQTIYNWADKNPIFLVTLDEIEQEQEKQLTSKGLKSEFNSTIVKLMLHNHGYSDRLRQDLTSDGEKVEISGFNYIKPDEADTDSD